jgi:tetratricopeptide (TPR) repeat protein
MSWTDLDQDLAARGGGISGLTPTELADAVWIAVVRADAEARREERSPASATDPASKKGGDGGEPTASQKLPYDDSSTTLATNLEEPGLAVAYLRSRLIGSAEAWPEFASASTGEPADALFTTAREADSGPGRLDTALHDGAAIAHALRPLKQTVPSATESELDEDTTATRAAADGLWLPYTKPAPGRWLDLTVVVDEGPSIGVFSKSITQFTRLLSTHGAFRDVRLRFLALQGSADPRRVILRGRRRGTGASDPAQLTNPLGRHVILVLTDGLSEVWRTGAALGTLALWGRSASVAVIHLLPQQSWHRTAVNPHRVRLRAPGPAAPNRRYVVDPVARRGSLDPLPGDWSIAIPIPVLELDREWLAWWARLVADPGTGWRDATVLLASAGGADARRELRRYQPDERPSRLPTGRERVLEFRASASPTAVRLAMYLAATPLAPGLIETVRRTMLPESRPGHLAEIMLSGLVRPTDAPITADMPLAVPLDFVEGAREALLSGATRVDTARAFAVAAEEYGRKVPGTGAAQGALLAPDRVPDTPVNPDTLPFARVELAVLQALSGPYASRARRIGQAVADLDRKLALSSQAPSPPMPAFDTLVTPDRTNAPMDQEISAARLAVTSGAHASYADSAAEGVDVTTPKHSGGLNPIRPEFGSSIPSIWNVPARNPNFTGREELLAQLHEMLEDGPTTAVTPLPLHGMGGVGKSQLANEYVYRHADDYEIIWWIPAEQQTQILASLVELAQQMRLDVGTEANMAPRAVRDALRSGHPYANWLLVFDNAEDPAAVSEFFPTGGTGKGKGKILVTSRNLAWSTVVSKSLSIDVFRRQESRELLQRRNPDLSDSDADRLAEALGDLPLAIEQAASWRAMTGMSADEYLSLIDQKRIELLDVSGTAGYELSVAAAWNVSLDRLGESNKAALQLLQICAFMSPEPIARSLFRGSRAVNITPELDEVLYDPIKVGRAIRDISRYALARIDHRNNTLQLHRLVQAVLIERMPPDLQRQMRHAAHVLLANANPNGPSISSLWPQYSSLLPHVTASEVINCDDRWVRQLQTGMIRYLSYWGDHVNALGLGRRVTERWIELFGEEDEETLALRQFYGFLLRIMGSYREASEVDEQVLESYQRTTGEDDERTLSAQLQLAADMRIRGEFTASRESCELALSRSIRVFGEDDPATLNAAHSLSVSLRLTGEYRKAMALSLKTWEHRKKVLGPDDRATMNTLNGLAIDQRESGEYISARERQEATYRRAVAVFGAGNPFTIAAARNLAVCRRRAGDLAGARALSEEMLTRFQRRYGDLYPDTLATAASLAVDLWQAGELDASRDLGNTTAERFLATLGERHPHTLLVRANLAITLRLLGEVDTAYGTNVVILSSFREILGEDHPLTLACAHNVGTDLFALQNFDEALRQDTETLERLRRISGSDHPATLGCAANVALDLRATGDASDGDSLRSDTIARLRRVLGDGHPTTVVAVKGFRVEADIAPLPL